jgi:hypothetical protein
MRRIAVLGYLVTHAGAQLECSPITQLGLSLSSSAESAANSVVPAGMLTEWALPADSVGASASEFLRVSTRLDRPEQASPRQV